MVCEREWREGRVEEETRTMLNVEVLDSICDHRLGTIISRRDLTIRICAPTIINESNNTQRRAHFAILRCVKMWPSPDAVTTLSGTRESEHPIQRICAQKNGRKHGQCTPLHFPGAERSHLGGLARGKPLEEGGICSSHCRSPLRIRQDELCNSGIHLS